MASMRDKIDITIENEGGIHTGSLGHRIYIDGEKGSWHYGPCDKTTIAVYSRYIQGNAKEGGTITDPYGKVTVVEGCPTGHANVSDDFMGGSVCLDCRAVW